MGQYNMILAARDKVTGRPENFGVLEWKDVANIPPVRLATVPLFRCGNTVVTVPMGSHPHAYHCVPYSVGSKSDRIPIGSGEAKRSDGGPSRHRNRGLLLEQG